MMTIYCIVGYGCGNSSLPIGIPGGLPRGSVGSLSQSPPSPFGSFPHQLLTNQQKNDDHVCIYSICIQISYILITKYT